MLSDQFFFQKIQKIIFEPFTFKHLEKYLPSILFNKLRFLELGLQLSKPFEFLEIIIIF